MGVLVKDLPREIRKLLMEERVLNPDLHSNPITDIITVNGALFWAGTRQGMARYGDNRRSFWNLINRGEFDVFYESEWAKKKELPKVLRYKRVT